jgi:hypothetical protein
MTDLLIGQVRAFSEIAAFIFSTWTKERLNAATSESVKFIDRA